MFKQLTAVVMGLALLGGVQPALASDTPTIMIMGEDDDVDTVPRHSRIFNRVQDQLVNAMNELGFTVFDETAVTKGITDPGRTRRSDAELITVAEAVEGRPIDVIVVFQVYASVTENPYADIQGLLLRVTGRLLQVGSGRRLGSFEASLGDDTLRPIPAACDRDCVLETVGEDAQIIAREVGIVLARKMDALFPASAAPEPAMTAEAPTTASRCAAVPSGYVVELVGYDTDDVVRIERLFTAFHGYDHHRTLASRTRFAEFWYESCSESARLERNFRQITEMFPGQNVMSFGGNTVRMEAIPSTTRR